MKVNSKVEISMDSPSIEKYINMAFDGDSKKYEEHINKFLEENIRFFFNKSASKSISITASTKISKED